MQLLWHRMMKFYSVLMRKDEERRSKCEDYLELVLLMTYFEKVKIKS